MSQREAAETARLLKESEAARVADIAAQARDLVEHTEDVGQHAQMLAGRAREVHRRSEAIAADTVEVAGSSDLADAVERLTEGVADSTAALAKHADGADGSAALVRGVTKLKRDLKRHTEALVDETQLVTERSLKVAKKSSELARRAKRVDDQAKGLALKTQDLALRTQELAATSDLVGASPPAADVGMLEIELRKQNHELAELNRFKTELLHSVSHELRTPLTSIQGYTEFLEDNLGGELSPKQAAFVSQIKRGVDRLKQHVDDLLDFSRLEGGTIALSFQPTNFGTLLQSVVSSLEPAIADAQLAVELSLATEAPDVVVDPRRIEQVVFNLLGNAIKFSKPGGTIRIRTSFASSGHLCEVEDAGIGIAEEDLPKLFQRFTQLAGGLRLGLGAGLGLNISKKLVEAHHGEMGVRSVLGRGSTFWFSVPA